MGAKFNVTRERVRQIQKPGPAQIAQDDRELGEKQKFAKPDHGQPCHPGRNQPTPSGMFRIFRKPASRPKDITPVLADARLFHGAIELLTENFQPGAIDAVVRASTRADSFSPRRAATRLNAGFVPVRKKGRTALSNDRGRLRPGIRSCDRGHACGRLETGHAGAARG